MLGEARALFQLVSKATKPEPYIVIVIAILIVIVLILAIVRVILIVIVIAIVKMIDINPKLKCNMVWHLGGPGLKSPCPNSDKAPQPLTMDIPEQYHCTLAECVLLEQGPNLSERYPSPGPFLKDTRLWRSPSLNFHMTCSLNSLKGGYITDYIGVTKGDTRNLDYSSYWFKGV